MTQAPERVRLGKSTSGRMCDFGDAHGTEYVRADLYAAKEAALLAAEELADKADGLHKAFAPFVPHEVVSKITDENGYISIPGDVVIALLEVLTAYRKATEGAA